MRVPPVVAQTVGNLQRKARGVDHLAEKKGKKQTTRGILTKTELEETEVGAERERRDLHRM